MTAIRAARTIPFLHFAALIFCCCAACPAMAQLQASFVVDKFEGCSPLTVKFTNTSTGTSAGTTWQWDFGNGNSSALKDPGATYFTEKTYKVTLTVKDGATSSTSTKDIMVYKKPTVDFSVSPSRGCAPLPVKLIANASAGDGTVGDYLWDFGDGENIQGPNYTTTSHTYNFPQVPPITLNVTNSKGCYTTVTKSNLVQVVPGVKAAFSPSTTTLCNPGESVTFTNTSTGSGTLSYKWDFGDGKTSTEPAPAHAYSTRGNFVATLTTTSSEGCSATTRSEQINVANFSADVDIPATICLNQNVTFVNKSLQPFDKAEWWFDDLTYGYTTTNGSDYSTAFYEPGEHTLKLIVYYGNCTVTKTKKFTVNKLPVVNDFIAELQGACGVPVTIKFKDTSTDAVAWQWQNNYYSAVFGTTKNTTHTYTTGGEDFVTLTTTNSAGCSASIGKYIYYDKPTVYIRLTSTSNGSYEGCTGLKLGFAADPDSIIKSFQWNFGDGTPLSTERAPSHTFNKAGSYSVILDYITNNGCTGRVYYNNITVVNHTDFDFTSRQGTTICGNTPDTLTATPAISGWNYSWAFNEDYTYYYGNAVMVKQFNYDTTYSVTMIADSYGCRDTVVKKNYIKVLPPFPRISQYFNTCDNTRGEIRFTEISAKAQKWAWDFGDGITTSYTSFRDTVRHLYTKTGTFKVVLSASNGGCTVRDSINVYVLLKQHPVLSVPKVDACGSDVVSFKLSGYEFNPYNYVFDGYYINNLEYGDGTPVNGALTMPNYYWQQEVNGTLAGLDPGKKDLRMITSSYVFGCYDTSNLVPLKIHGPTAGFLIQPHSGCFKDAVFFTDTSRKSGASAIVRWEWDFGDGGSKVLTGQGSTSYVYSTPGYYYVKLKVTDADGCTSLSDNYLHYVTIGGPRADFTASAYNVPPNTTVSFSNTSLFYNYYDLCRLKWIFSDGTTSTDEYTSFNFEGEGAYIVKLVTQNLQTGCTDTVQKTITVRKVNSAFTYRLSYINSNLCPPVIASFTSISSNAARLAWDFGDGGVAGDQQNASHTYNNPGIYRVVHYSYDSNGAVDSTEDFIEVKGPYALLKANKLAGCGSLQVKLTAEVRYASDYTWDFGDGTVVPTTDTFATHTYLTPGIYVPALILRDAGGCSATSSLPDRIVVDTLSVSFKPSPATICDSALSLFIPQVYSLSDDQLQEPVKYTWVVAAGGRTDTLYGAAASYYFNTLGTYRISLEASTAYGCMQQASDSVVVRAGIAASIAGPANVCAGDKASFTGSATPANAQLQWKWAFANGGVSNLQNPAPQQFTAAGLQQLSLVVSNGSCSDTVLRPVMVNPLPSVRFTPANPFVCLGGSVLITAAGGLSYQWSASIPIDNNGSESVEVSPASDLFYIVKLTDANTCSSKDSVKVKVIMPVKLIAAATQFACEGNPVQLSVSGAETYQWINHTTGLSNTAIANPSALTTGSVTYTVVGYEAYHCFTDTANINVRISPLPLVDAGQGRQLVAGTAYTLAPVVSGATSLNWSPADYLDCTTCLNPVSKPKSSLVYTLTAVNADGCKASDTVSLKLICKDNLVFIPTAFSPNNDNLNDRFLITGSGVKAIRSISVYSRWGKLVFQRKNINVSDRGNSWDGYFNGEPLPAAAYVYAVQAECEGGEIFNYRGTVMLVR